MAKDEIAKQLEELEKYLKEQKTYETPDKSGEQNNSKFYEDEFLNNINIKKFSDADSGKAAATSVGPFGSLKVGKKIKYGYFFFMLLFFCIAVALIIFPNLKSKGALSIVKNKIINVSKSNNYKAQDVILPAFKTDDSEDDLLREFNKIDSDKDKKIFLEKRKNYLLAEFQNSGSKISEYYTYLPEEFNIVLDTKNPDKNAFKSIYETQRAASIRYTNNELTAIILFDYVYSLSVKLQNTIDELEKLEKDDLDYRQEK